MWRRAFAGALQRFPAAPLSSRVATPSAALAHQQRTFFERDHRCPVTVKKDGLRYAAVLSWRYRSDRPRHVVVNVLRPTTSNMSAGEDILNEEAEEATGTDRGRPTVSYHFGRLFLRPYNVGQLLAVLQGWTQAPASIAREHTSLTLTPSRPGELSSFFLRGTFTTKRLPRVPPNESDATSGATAALEDDDSTQGSTYNLDDVRTVEVELADSELVLLTVHLEAVLRDLFRVEHSYHYQMTRRSLDRQRERLIGSSASPRFASRERSTGQYRSQSPAHVSRSYASATRRQQQQRPAPRPPSPRAVEREDLSAPFDDDKDVQSLHAARAAASAAVSAYASATTAKAKPTTDAGGHKGAEEDGDEADLEEEVEEEMEEEVEVEVDDNGDEDTAFSVDDADTPVAGAPLRPGEEVFSDIPRPAATSAAPAATTAEAPPGADGDDGEEEYEEVEVVEEVEEDDGDGDSAAPTESTAHGADSSSPLDDAGAASHTTTSTTTAAIHSPPFTATKPTSAQEIQQGRVKMESEDHYTSARFVRGDNFQAAEVAEVGKVLGLDVVQTTKVASVTNVAAAGDRETKETAALTSGMFRAEGGGLTGSYEVLRRRVESTSTGPVGKSAVAGDGDADAAAEEREGQGDGAQVAAEGKKQRKRRSKKKGKAKRKGKARKAAKANEAIEENLSF